MIREGKGAWPEVEYREINGADKVKDVYFVMGGEGDMLGEREKFSNKVVNSNESLQVGESMWILKSPSNSRRGERVDASVRSSVRSERNEGLGLGGR